MPRWTESQKQAIEKSGMNIMVSAGAGSGKTAVLSERVIYKIENGIHVNELLILTFTKAAALEMKDRIRKKIKNKDELKDELNLLNSAYITTFDSFALSIVKKYHYLLNISDDIQITDESVVSIASRKVLDDVFEKMYQDISFNESFGKLVKKYCVKNDKILRDNILGMALKIDSYIDSYEFIKWVREDFYSEENILKLTDEYVNMIDFFKNAVRVELSNLRYYFDSSYVDKVEESLSGILNSKMDEFSSFRSVSLPNVPRGSSEEAKSIKAALKGALDKLLSYTVYGNLDDIKINILNSKDYVGIILDVISNYLCDFRKYKQDREIYTFNDIAKMAITILRDNPNVRDEVRDTFKEIMIDEYQDTNDIQELFISMISNNNVYMVGDIKQSIYRFRGSNPSIFKRKYENYTNNVDGCKIDLIKNFRSRSEVLDNINKLFCLLMDIGIGDASYKDMHQMVYGNNSYDVSMVDGYDYNFKILEYLNDYRSSGYSDIEVEIFTIACDIKKKISDGFMVYDKDLSILRKATYNDFVIILDRSKYFDLFKKIFEYLKVPLTILRDGKLNSSVDILLIKNIVDFVIRIKDGKSICDDVLFKYDYISIARSFLYEYSDDYIFDVVTSNGYKDTSIYKDLSKLVCFVDSSTSSNFFEAIIDVTSFYNKINKIGGYEEVNVRISTIYTLARSLSDLRMSPREFSEYLNDIVNDNVNIKYATYDDGADSVKILTIHKSKGLEYPVCYYADLAHAFNVSEFKDKFICDRRYGLIVDLDMDCMEVGSVLKEIYRFNFIREEIGEKIRLFYVALTRAREQMILVLPTCDSDNIDVVTDEDGVIDKVYRMRFNKMSSFLYGCKKYLSEYFSYVDLENIELSKDYLYNNVLNEYKAVDFDFDFDVSEVVVDSNAVDKGHFSKGLCDVVSGDTMKYIRYGLEIHEILEYLDFKNVDLSFVSDEFIKGKLSNFFDNELFLNISNASIYKEYEFVYVNSGKECHGVIDLMLEYEDIIYIVDYKLKGIVDVSYKKQVDGYRKYVERVSGKRVKAYLYSILDSLFLEV